MKSRQEVIKQFGEYMLIAIEEGQIKGDDWEKNWTELSELLDERAKELKENLYWSSVGHKSVGKNTLLKCGGVISVIAAIIDKLSNEGV